MAWACHTQTVADALAGGVISSYMHWKDGPVDGLGDAMYMPMLEKSDDSSGSQFNSVIAGLSSPPKVVLGQNEIDTDATYTEPSVACVPFFLFFDAFAFSVAHILCCSLCQRRLLPPLRHPPLRRRCPLLLSFHVRRSSLIVIFLVCIIGLC